MFDVKNKIAKHCVESQKSKRKTIKVGNILWTNKAKRKGHSKINYQIKYNLYVWITCHPQVVK